MLVHRALAATAAVTVLLLAACTEPPFAPRWDADMYMPLSTQPIALLNFAAFIPGGTSVNVSFPAQEQEASGVIGDLLKNMVTDPARCTLASNPSLSCDLLTLTVTHPAGLSAQGTLYVADAQADLTNPQPQTIVFPVTVPATMTETTDSLYLTQASVAMLQAAGDNGTTLWVQYRGQVGNPGVNSVTVTAADTVHVTLAATVRVAVSHE